MARNQIVICCLLLICGLNVSYSAEITIQNASKLQKIAQLKGHTGPVFTLAFSPDSKLLLSGGSAQDHSVRLWDVSGGAQRALLSGNTAQVAAVAFNADGSKAISAGYDRTIRVWDTKGTPVTTMDRTGDGSLLDIGNLFTVFSANGAALIYAPDMGNGPLVLNLQTRKQMVLNKTVQPADEGPGNVALNDSGSLIAAQGKDGIIHLIDSTGKELGVITAPDNTDFGSNLAFSRDGTKLAVANVDTSEIRVYAVATKKPGPALLGHKKDPQGMLRISGVVFNPSGQMLASSSYDHTVIVWDVNSGKAAAILNAGGKGPSAVAWSPDGSVIASGDLDGTITLWAAR